MEGRQIRLNRLFKRSDRLFIVPMDHGVTIGAVGGLKDMHRVVQAVSAGGADAIVVHKGIARRIGPALKGGDCELIVHLSGSTALGPAPNRKELVASPEHAVQLGATAVSVHVNLGDPAEPEMLRDLGRVSEQCQSWGMPLLAMMYVRDGSKESEFHPGKVAHAARIAEELGADIVKVNYTGSVETFSGVVSAVSIPVIIAGGPKAGSLRDLLLMIRDAVRAGARGVAIGRNIFEDQNPAGLSALVRRILDDPQLAERDDAYLDALCADWTAVSRGGS
ncbi:MAG: 2-amino-3,7-dideoxy-D-threo-hept-6-ulosonate synthase [Bacillota bacterium]|nr:2-amino-3,7-dideoxy-D-threo-hept-6-ulosonate synthase [Bacillota bacterium]